MANSFVSLLVPIPASLRKAVRVEAARRDLTMAEFVRQALDAAVALQNQEPSRV